MATTQKSQRQERFARAVDREVAPLWHDRFARLIGGYLRDAIRVGDIEPVDVEVVSYAWMGAIYAVIIRWVYTGEPEPQRIVDALLPVLLKSVGHEDRNEPAVADLR